MKMANYLLQQYSTFYMYTDKIVSIDPKKRHSYRQSIMLISLYIQMGLVRVKLVKTFGHVGIENADDISELGS
ncbi:hypothetical protein XELAEV_18042140mg [Xenopus laevis]|uniref:Uncharacterized protein n=1 Tax=Xenopus laevis TaxID=8355 RepID=A0A974C3I5_XENLA|nr:hypothetical protein XELAEV_18042140mg [Xenopus laevis]